MWKNNIRAFTILEMLINIAIMSIIIGIVYFVYSSFARQVSNYQINIEEQMEFDSFSLQLKTDFFNAEKIVALTDSFEILFYNTKSVKYEITDKYLLRKQNQNVDSLRIIKVTLDRVSSLDSSANLIRKVIVTAPLFNEPIEYVVTKKYSRILDYKYNNGS